MNEAIAATLTHTEDSAGSWRLATPGGSLARTPAAPGRICDLIAAQTSPQRPPADLVEDGRGAIAQAAGDPLVLRQPSRLPCEGAIGDKPPSAMGHFADAPADGPAEHDGMSDDDRRGGRPEEGPVDRAAGVLAGERERVAREREAIAKERELIADEREQVAGEREDLAARREEVAESTEAWARQLKLRDRVAEERERIADEREAIADERERLADEREGVQEARRRLLAQKEGLPPGNYDSRLISEAAERERQKKLREEAEVRREVAASERHATQERPSGSPKAQT